MSVREFGENEADFDWAWAEKDEGDWVPPSVDSTVPSIARIYDYLLGGKDNFAVDRAAAAQVRQAIPGIDEQALVNRGFLVRAVSLLAARGIEQFIDLGCGLPTSPNVHEVARRVHAQARVVYVDNDPIVLAHNRALVTKDPGVSMIMHDFREPDAILGDPRLRKLIDFSQPVGLLLIGVAHFVRHDVAPEMILRYRKALAPGSALVLSAACTATMRPEDVARVEAVYANSTAPFVGRSIAQIEQLFEGFELMEPGLVESGEWRAEAGAARVPAVNTVAMAGVGFKL
jgi:O-methyltransferase involved in polyketide biosynthesis